jgi:hypothetical protein
MARWIFARCFIHTRREFPARLREESGRVRRWRSEDPAFRRPSDLMKQVRVRDVIEELGIACNDLHMIIKIVI